MGHKGLFLSLDGLDGTGKSTQCRLLVDWLRQQGHPTVFCVDPGGTPLGQQLRQILLVGQFSLAQRCEALLFMASRAQLVEEIIRPALESGHTVVSDRYLLANVVYQGHAGGLDVETLWKVGAFSTGGIEPDQTYVLDLPLAVAMERRGRPADRMESQPWAYHERVRAGFLREAHLNSGRIVVIDATPAVDVIQTELRRHVTHLLDGRKPR